MSILGLDPEGVDGQAARALQVVDAIRSSGGTLHRYLSMVDSLDLIEDVGDSLGFVADDIKECCDLLSRKSSEVSAADQGFGVPMALAGAFAGMALGFSLNGLDIPGPPADPKQPLGDGSGEHGDFRWSWKLWEWDFEIYKLYKKWEFYVAGADLKGLDDAALHLSHYLQNSGEDLVVDPDRIRADEPDLDRVAQARIDRWAEGQAAEALKQGKPVSFRTGWEQYTAETDNWYFAMGTFSYAVSGVATPQSDGSVTVEYQVHVFDRYNWDPGKGVVLPGEEKATMDEELGRLHQAGVAQEYVIRGSSDPGTVNVDPNGVVEHPPDEDGDD